MPDTGDGELDELMLRAYDEGVRLGTMTGDDLRTPVLICVDGRGHKTLVVINTTAGVHPADAARVTIWKLRAERAAICSEGWAVDVEHTAEGARPPRPDPRPSEHPDRYEVLSVVGQTRGSAIRMWQYRIVRELGRPRRFEARSLEGGVVAAGRFNPLFLSDAQIGELVRRNTALARMRSDLQSRRS